jgi:Tfp pilus assembly protein PilV
MVRTRRRRDGGMTLIEVLIALAVTMAALLGALATVGMTIRTSAFSRAATEASTLAQAQLEALVSLSNVTASNPVDNTSTTEPPMDGNGLSAPNGNYTRTTAWSTTTDGRRQVTVTVAWVDGFNVTHQVMASRQKVPQ